LNENSRSYLNLGLINVGHEDHADGAKQAADKAMDIIRELVE